MSQSIEVLDRLLRGPVRWRKAPSDQGTKRRRPSLAEDLQTVARVTARTPEVMVRISGKARGAKHVEEHLRYISRDGELSAEDESGRLVTGRRMVQETAAAWMEGSTLNRRNNSRDTVNVILSMPPGTDREKLLAAARQFALEGFAQLRVVFGRGARRRPVAKVGQDARHTPQLLGLLLLLRRRRARPACS